ncbi:hypothetical protein QYE76_056610 [Lolium multiflorum]|uniref:Uncharacterized protein n=1 Tax=Lolium multiflorum TaxID=4521 RepID=A0AAD8T3B1_LOLMU|nr:hypothetical protein QYE76_056610 [Lolium multiflorum]
MSDGKLPQPAEISAENIIKPSFDDLSAEQLEAYEALKRKRQEQLEALEKQRKEEFEALKKRQEEEDRETFLASFKKDRQGGATSLGEVKLPPLLGDPAEPSVSTSLFSADQLAAINHYATESSRQAYDAMVEYLKASKNTPQDASVNVGTGAAVGNPNPTLPTSSAVLRETPMNPYFSQDNQIMTAPTCPSPIRSVPYSVIPPNQVPRPAATNMAPNFNSIQLAINDGRLSFADMQIDKQPFPMNTLELQGKKVLIRPEAAGSANKNNVVVGEPRNSRDGNKDLGREIVLGKQPNGKETLKITIKNPTLGGQSQVQRDVRAKFIKPKSPEVGKWKTNEVKKSTRDNEMKWRPKSPCAEISESSKQQENSTNVNSVIIGTQELKLKEPVVVDEPANSKKVILNIPPRSSANDHEASTSKAKPRDPKYTQPKWCPLGLTKTQKRRLQRMRNQEKVEHTAEKRRDEFFDKTHRVPYKKWVLKKVEGAAVPMTIAKTAPSSEEKDVNIDELTTPLPTTPGSVPISEDDEELVDFENSPAREGMDMNMVYYLPSEFRAVDEEGEVAQLDFGPKNAIFEKPKEPVKHLKPLYVKGHINGSPVARMLVDGGAVVNLMPCSVFKKLGLDENDLMKTNMVLNGFEGKEKTEAKGVMSVELTVGSKSLATAFFIAEVQGKKGSNKLRLCIDFRDLNRATPKDEYPMPIADMLINDASGHKVISFLDGNAGYNQIFMAEEDAFKTAFRCPGFVGLFEWTVMTFGLKNVGATYQRAMNLIFHDLLGVILEVYIDDIVVKSDANESHLADLRLAFERMRKYGLKMNPLKCAFGVSAGKFLGFIIHQRGIEIDPGKIQAIQKVQAPTCKKDMQKFLGKVNYLRRFIVNLSGKVDALTPILRLKNDDDFTWGSKQQEAFENIKLCLSTPPVLRAPKHGELFRLYIAVEEGVIGAVLTQETEEKEHVITYLSRRLLDAETRQDNWNANELAQQASGYHVDRGVFHISHEPMFALADIGS